MLVHVSTPLEECERRDRKGLYAKARAGEIPEFTGISSPYDEPTDAAVHIDTTGRTIEDCLEDLMPVLPFHARGPSVNDLLTTSALSVLVVAFGVGIVVGLTGMGGGALMTPGADPPGRQPDRRGRQRPGRGQHQQVGRRRACTGVAARPTCAWPGC